MVGGTSCSTAQVAITSSILALEISGLLPIRICLNVVILSLTFTYFRQSSRTVKQGNVEGMCKTRGPHLLSSGVPASYTRCGENTVLRAIAARATPRPLLTR